MQPEHRRRDAYAAQRHRVRRRVGVHADRPLFEWNVRWIGAGRVPERNVPDWTLLGRIRMRIDSAHEYAVRAQQ